MLLLPAAYGSSQWLSGLEYYRFCCTVEYYCIVTTHLVVVYINELVLVVNYYSVKYQLRRCDRGPLCHGWPVVRLIQPIQTIRPHTK